MKNLKDLNGVKSLSKMEQRAINGGQKMCLWSPTKGYYCPAPYTCVGGICVLTPA